ncbi:MAG: TolC family protein [Acidobacteriota bacterium]
MSGRHLSLVMAVVGASLGGCVHYQARPLARDAPFNRLDARDLTDPGLARAATAARVAPEWPPTAWDLQALTVAALYFHPDLAVARATWDVARAGLVSAEERPNPSATAGPGFNASTPAHTITPWILNLDLDFTIETAGKRGFRRDEATRLASAARLQVADAAWRVRAGVRQALVDLFAATETSALLDRQRALLDANLVLFQRQLDAGEISAFQMSQARLQLDTLRLAAADAQRRQQDARARLATAIGLPVVAIDSTSLSFDVFRRSPPAVPDDVARRQALVNRADVLSALARYDASQATLQLEIARQYPDLHLGPGYQMDQNSHKWSLLFPLSLPAFNRNQGRIGEAESRRLQAAAEVDAVQARAIGALDRALATYRAALAGMALAEQMTAELQRSADTAQQQWAAGAISQLDLGVVQLELATRELARLDALVQAQQAIGDIEDAMQIPAELPVSAIPEPPR